MMANIKNIISVGSRVQTNIGNIEAIVIGICVRGQENNTIEYHLGYFIKGEYQTSWVHSFEVTEKIDRSKPMGFTPQKNKPLIEKP